MVAHRLIGEVVDSSLAVFLVESDLFSSDRINQILVLQGLHLLTSKISNIYLSLMGYIRLLVVRFDVEEVFLGHYY